MSGPSPDSSAPPPPQPSPPSPPSLSLQLSEASALALSDAQTGMLREWVHTAQVRTYVCTQNNILYERIGTWMLYAGVLLGVVETGIVNRSWTPPWLASLVAILLAMVAATLAHWDFMHRSVAYHRAAQNWQAFDQQVRLLCATADPIPLVAQMPALKETYLQLENTTPVSSAGVQRRAITTLSQWIPPRELMGISTVRIDPPGPHSPRRPSLPTWPDQPLGTPV